MKIRTVLAAALVAGATAFSLQAQAEEDCNERLVQLDAMITEKGSALGEDVLEQVNNLRNDGEAACQAGDQEEAKTNFDQAEALFAL